MPFFTFEVLPKIENKTEAQLVVGGQPTQILGLSNLLFYVDPKFSDHLKAYKTLMKSILALMAKDTGSSRWMGSKAIEKTAQSIIDFETKLAKIFTSFQSWDSKERVDSMKLSELQKIIGKKVSLGFRLKPLNIPGMHRNSDLLDTYTLLLCRGQITFLYLPEEQEKAWLADEEGGLSVNIVNSRQHEAKIS